MATGPGSDLYFERRGDGPPLLLITGGGGDAGYYSALAGILAAEYTVLTYDRRGNSRSRMHGPPGPVTIAGQSEDALAVLAANGFAGAHVFGNSGGATIALDLAAYHPGTVRAVIAHEPPVPRVLPDPDEVLAAYDEFSRLLAADGWQAALTFFQTRVGPVPPDRPEVWDYLLRPETVLPPGPERDLMTRMSRNWEFMTRYEVRSFIDYVPDTGAIAANGVRIALAHGTQSADLAEFKAGAVLAERLAAEYPAFPGGHSAPLEIPVPFAAVLREVLARLGG